MRKLLLLTFSVILAACDSITEPPTTYSYQVILPDGYNQNPTATWPLIFALHGAGGIGDLAPVFDAYGASDTQFPFIVILPDAEDFGWITTSLRGTLDDVKTKFRVDSERIYATGMSAGAYAAWRLAASRPNDFAAIVLTAGGGLDDFACSLKHVPTWLLHNQNDPVVPTSESTELYDAIVNCGGLARLTIYPPPTGYHPHDAWRPTYSNPAFYDWLLRHRRGQPGALN
jgi:predicted peptidase